MDLVDQLKTPQGRIPVQGVRLLNDDCGTWLEFDARDPMALASSANGNEARLHALPSIEDLAFVDKESLLELAKRTGPLFGAGSRESVFDWQSVANVARAVVTVQEVANGVKPMAVLRADDEQGSAALVAKTQVKNTETGNDFSIYAISFAVDAALEDGYVAHMPGMPWLKKFVGDGFDYVIGDVEREADGGDFLTVTLLSFKREITALDFALVLSCFYDQSRAAKLIDQAKRSLSAFSDGEISESMGAATVEGKLEICEAPLAEDDIPSLRRLVQAIISLHLEGVRVDLFRSTEDDDFLSFDTYLSYLWFLFSKKLGDVKIGYCMRCGKAFSLARRRGVPKKYCSEECKTADKNERARQTQVQVRQAFIDGAGVAEIAAKFFPKQAGGVACGKVRRMLATWVDLKHRIDDDIAHGKGELAKRCVAENVFTEVDIARRVKALSKKR